MTTEPRVDPTDELFHLVRHFTMALEAICRPEEKTRDAPRAARRVLHRVRGFEQGVRGLMVEEDGWRG